MSNAQRADFQIMCNDWGKWFDTRPKDAWTLLVHPVGESLKPPADIMAQFEALRTLGAGDYIHGEGFGDWLVEHDVALSEPQPHMPSCNRWFVFPDNKTRLHFKLRFGF